MGELLGGVDTTMSRWMEAAIQTGSRPTTFPNSVAWWPSSTPSMR